MQHSRFRHGHCNSALPPDLPSIKHFQPTCHSALHVQNQPDFDFHIHSAANLRHHSPCAPKSRLNRQSIAINSPNSVRQYSPRPRKSTNQTSINSDKTRRLLARKLNPRFPRQNKPTSSSKFPFIVAAFCPYASPFDHPIQPPKKSTSSRLSSTCLSRFLSKISQIGSPLFSPPFPNPYALYPSQIITTQNLARHACHIGARLASLVALRRLPAPIGSHVALCKTTFRLGPLASSSPHPLIFLKP
jgi:hypothetical protein